MKFVVCRRIRRALSSLLDGKASLSADTAIRLEKPFGVKADTLRRIQTSYELAPARRREGEIKVGKLALAT